MKTYIKPTLEIVELRPEDIANGNGAGPSSNCGWHGNNKQTPSPNQCYKHGGNL